MSADDVIKIILAVVGALTVIGAGLKWLITTITSALSDNTKAIGAASAAQVAAWNELRVQLVELRVEVRTLLGMRPPAEDDISDDGTAPKLTPVRGVPDARGLYTITRKTKE